MNSATTARAKPADGRIGPIALLLAAVVAAALLLALPLKLPLGAMYWDLVVYVDGAQRVLTGQVPLVDFFAPVGPLGYWLIAGLMRIYGDAQLLLLAQWSLLAVTAPAMALVLWSVGRAAPATSYALLLPFLFFQLLPMNVEQYATYPGVDGYGIYNRQVSEILYVLVAALVFVRRQRVLFAVVAWCCLALFLLKVTGFIAAGMICAFAFGAGRVRLSTTLLILAAFAAPLALLEIATGLVGAYLASIATLVAMNEGELARRFLQGASIHFGILGPIAALGVTLLWLGRQDIRTAGSALFRSPSAGRIATLLDRDVLWLGSVAFAGLFFETQNTGGQALIFIWPVLLSILMTAGKLGGTATVLVLTLVAATALPPVVNVAHRTVRAMIGQMNYVALPAPYLRGLSAVTQRAEIVERAETMLAIYAEYRPTFEAIALRRQLPGFTMYAEIDFQAAWMMSASDAVEAVLAYERENGVRFETIMALNFANPFPYALDRVGTRHIAIGADPFRAVPPPDANVMEAVAGTDLVLYPTCPVTVANERLRDLYAPALTSHRRIDLTPCWQAYIR